MNSRPSTLKIRVTEFSGRLLFEGTFRVVGNQLLANSAVFLGDADRRRARVEVDLRALEEIAAGPAAAKELAEPPYGASP